MHPANSQYIDFKTAVRGHSFVHRKAGQNSKSMANVFVSQKYLTQIQLAQLTLLKNNYYRKPNLEFCWETCNPFKGVLHPDTKISMFCLFSPSSRRKSILFMYGCDRCVWFKVKRHDIFSMDLPISHVERFKIFFSFSTLEITLKSTELIHAFTIVGIIPSV